MPVKPKTASSPSNKRGSTPSLTTGETWTLAGQERIEAGPLQRETTVAQTWMLELAVVDELISVGQRLNAAAGEAHALREQLAALRAQAAEPPGAAARDPLT